MAHPDGTMSGVVKLLSGEWEGGKVEDDMYLVPLVPTMEFCH